MKLTKFALIFLPLVACSEKKGSENKEVPKVENSVVQKIVAKIPVSGTVIEFSDLTLTFVGANKGESPRSEPVLPTADSMHIDWDENCFAELCGPQNQFIVHLKENSNSTTISEFNSEFYYGYYVTEDGSGGMPKLEGFEEIKGSGTMAVYENGSYKISVLQTFEPEIEVTAKLQLQEKSIQPEPGKSLELKPSSVKLFVKYQSGSEIKSKTIWIHLNYGD